MTEDLPPSSMINPPPPSWLPNWAKKRLYTELIMSPINDDRDVDVLLGGKPGPRDATKDQVHYEPFWHSWARSWCSYKTSIRPRLAYWILGKEMRECIADPCPYCFKLIYYYPEGRKKHNQPMPPGF